MKALKILCSLIAILVISLIAVVIALPQFVDPNDYRDQITQTVKEKTGLQLSINGDLSLSVFPWIGVKTGNIALAQPSDIAKTGNFIELDEANIKVKLKPLFSRKIEVDTILLKKPQIHLIVNTAGKSSIDSITASLPSDSADNTPAPTDSTANNTKAIAALTVAGINIANGQLIYDDKQTKSLYQVGQLNITSGNLLGGNPAPLSISALLSGNQAGSDIAPVTFSLKTQARLNKEALALSVSNFSSSISQGITTLDTNIAELSYDHQASASQLRNIKLSGSAENIPFAASIPELSVDINKTIINIPNLSVESLGVKLLGNIMAKKQGEIMLVRGKLQSNPFNAKEIIKTLGIDYTASNPKALEKISFRSDFNASEKGLSLQDTKINIDDSRLEGNVSIVNFEQPNYRFDLALNEIVIDDYLPPTEEATTNSSDSSDEPITPTQALIAPIALLKDINANGVFRAGKITANNLTLDSSEITVASTSKHVVVTPKVSLYKGNLDGKITLTKSATPTLSIVNALRNVNLEPLLTDAEITDQFSGIANIDTNITVVDNKANPSTQGTIKLLAKNGAIKGVNIKNILDQSQGAIDKLRGKTSTESTASAEDETQFAEMTATLLLNNDIVTNNDLTVKAPVFRINGKGKVDTKQQTVDYLTSVVVVNTNQGQGGEDRENLKGLTIPVRFTGPLTEPKPTIDYKALLKANTGKLAAAKKEELKAKAKEKVLKKLNIDTNKSTQETKQEIKEKLKDKAEEKLKDKFKSLFR